MNCWHEWEKVWVTSLSFPIMRICVKCNYQQKLNQRGEVVEEWVKEDLI